MATPPSERPHLSTPSADSIYTCLFPVQLYRQTPSRPWKDPISPHPQPTLFIPVCFQFSYIGRRHPALGKTPSLHTLSRPLSRPYLYLFVFSSVISADGTPPSERPHISTPTADPIYTCLFSVQLYRQTAHRPGKDPISPHPQPTPSIPACFQFKFISRQHPHPRKYPVCSQSSFIWRQQPRKTPPLDISSRLPSRHDQGCVVEHRWLLPSEGGTSLPSFPPSSFPQAIYTVMLHTVPAPRVSLVSQNLSVHFTFRNVYCQATVGSDFALSCFSYFWPNIKHWPTGCQFRLKNQKGFHQNHKQKKAFVNRGANPTRWQNLQFSKFDRKILKLAGRFLENVSNT